MDRFKGKITGKPHISWENLWFPVDFPLNQSIECMLAMYIPDSGGISSDHKDHKGELVGSRRG
jgi:hypothetical protein